MPLHDSGPLAGFYTPDEPGGTIVNLMASIISARGGRSPHPPLDGLDLRSLERASHLVYLVIDGLGCTQLERYRESLGPGTTLLGAGDYRTISTVFPATTAAAVTTFLTGASPAEHAILGWQLNLHDLGIVSTVLLSESRSGAPGYPDDFDLAAYLAVPAHVDSVPGPRAQVAWGPIPSSRFSRAASRWQDAISIDTLGDLVAETTRLVERMERGLAYVYWPHYDALCHGHGCADPRTLAHLAEIDAAVTELAAQVAARDAVLLVCADHGIHDTPADRRIDLAAVDGFYDCLATLPCGDAGHAACFVRPRRESRFLEIVASRLGHACACVPGETLLELGVFGPGTAHPALASRVADYFLIARDRHAFAAPRAGCRAEFMVGNHGGMDADEMRVPLFAVPG